MPALEEAIQAKNLEASSRAFEIVLRHFQKGSEENKAAAQAVLQRLAAGNDLVARKAKETLEKPKTSPMDEMNALNGRIRILGGGRVIIRGDGGLLPGPAGAAIPVGGGVFKSVSVSIANGIKSVTTQDGERTVKLKELADKTITGEITQKKEGKDTTDKIEAKSAEELKEKFPEAFKVYEQHFGKKEGAGLFGIGLGGKAGDLKEIKTQQFKAMAEHLEKIKTQASLPEETRERIITSLQEHLDRLDAELKKLETNESKK